MLVIGQPCCSELVLHLSLLYTPDSSSQHSLFYFLGISVLRGPISCAYSLPLPPLRRDLTFPRYFLTSHPLHPSSASRHPQPHTTLTHEAALPPPPPPPPPPPLATPKTLSNSPLTQLPTKNALTKHRSLPLPPLPRPRPMPYSALSGGITQITPSARSSPRPAA